MGFDTIHEALKFVEQLAAGTDALESNNIGQQLRDLDVYLQQTLKPKASPPSLSSKPYADEGRSNALLHAGKKRRSQEANRSGQGYYRRTDRDFESG